MSMTVDCVLGVELGVPVLLDESGLLAIATGRLAIAAGRQVKNDAEMRHNDKRTCYRKAADMDTMKCTRRTSHVVHMCHKTYRTRVELVRTQARHIHKCNSCETCAYIQNLAGGASGSPQNEKIELQCD